MIQLSKRLQAVADMIGEETLIVDVGTDHGYIPIVRILEGRNPKAVAMDINAGPLERAREHVNAQGLEDKIELILSDGLKNYTAGRTNDGNPQPATMVIAGMGGPLMVRILEDDAEKTNSFSELVLEPQSDVHKVRFFLRTNGWKITDENFIEEDGKFYPIVKAVRAEGKMPVKTEYDLSDYYGPILLKKSLPDFIRFLAKEHTQYVEVMQKLDDRNAGRRKEIQELLIRNARAIDMCRNGRIVR